MLTVEFTIEERTTKIIVVRDGPILYLVMRTSDTELIIPYKDYNVAKHMALKLFTINSGNGYKQACDKTKYNALINML